MKVEVGLPFYCFTSLLVLGLSALAEKVGEALVRNTVRISLAWYLAAVLIMLAFRTSADWQVSNTAARVARRCWTWAVVSFLIHLGMAFHYYHGWSHAHAFERTRQVSGVGEGIYVSYAFTIAWCGDMAWWWLSPAGYATRPRWVGRILHAFLLFVVVNGTIVFESGGIRWAGLLGVGAIAWRWRSLRTTGQTRWEGVDPAVSPVSDARLASASSGTAIYARPDESFCEAPQKTSPPHLDTPYPVGQHVERDRPADPSTNDECRKPAKR